MDVTRVWAWQGEVPPIRMRNLESLLHVAVGMAKD